MKIKIRKEKGLNKMDEEKMNKKEEKSENEGNEEEPTPEYSLDKSTYTGVSLVPGLCYQISDHFSLDLMLNLANITWELDKSIPCNSDKKADMKNATENGIFHFGGYATSYNNAEDIDNLVSVGVSYNF